KALNDCVPAALALIPVDLRPIVTHQSGKKHIEGLRAAYVVAQVQAEVVDFIDDMPRRYADADLVICRAGAITLSELTAAGVASVLVPLIVSTTSHQRANAEWMAQKHAAIHQPQGEMTAENLSLLLQTLTREECLTMALAAYAIGRRDANDMIADVLEELVSNA
ncbi:MAG: glycosyltransferase, partial [Oxalobacteraceae bacterium]